MKFVTAGKDPASGRDKSENNYIETIDFPKINLRTSVSFEHFIYNGEFDPGSG